MSLFDMLDVEEEPQKKEKPTKEKKDMKKTDKKQVNNVQKYKFPFMIHLAAENKDVSHIFEEGCEYTPKEITDSMLEHGFYDFAGSITYDFKEKDNVLVPIFHQHKKG